MDFGHAKSDGDHWDKIFSNTEDEKMGWYEKDSTQTFKLLKEIPGLEEATVFLPGAGTSGLIEDLIPIVKKLILNDISGVALDLVKQRLKQYSGKIEWNCQDISQPLETAIPEIDIWIDRAVLHFLTDKNDISGYFKNLKPSLKVGGHVIFAEFSLIGAPKCAGLTLHRYSMDELAMRLGPSFRIVSHFDYTYINPFGDPRPYIYALFKKQK